VTLFATAAYGQEWKTLLNLRGQWKIELGDSHKWADPAFDDSKWDDIFVPAPWEDEGFPGYDGYAWYRKHFTIDQNLKNNIVYLHVGYVDDVSEVYLNGHLLGFQGEFPPNFTTAYNVNGQYPVPQQYLNFNGDNVIAVRVFDQMLAGGITHGRIGLFEPKDHLAPDYNLAGTWKFTTGDDDSWKDAAANDSKWKNVIVPGYWEGQGFPDYNGMGWYRLKFKIPEQLIGKRLILMLGKIDDVDEAYVNGEFVGRTGRISRGMDLSDVNDEWLQPRAYIIPSDLLLPNQDNVLAVRVNDVYLHGGIYDGPIGFVTREKYLRWKKEGSPWRNFLDWFK
jgi:sialate O-acetylesterase